MPGFCWLMADSAAPGRFHDLVAKYGGALLEPSAGALAARFELVEQALGVAHGMSLTSGRETLAQVAAHPGQVLLDGTTAALAQERRLPEGAALEPLGHHRLIDLGPAVAVFQLVRLDHTGQPSPPLRSLSHFPNNLPILLNSFIGREAEAGRPGSPSTLPLLWQPGSPTESGWQRWPRSPTRPVWWTLQQRQWGSETRPAVTRGRRC